MRKVIQKDYKKYTRDLYHFYNDKRVMPTYEEMKSIFGVSSKDTVHRIINVLVSMGNVLKTDTGKITPVTDELIKAGGKKFKEIFQNITNNPKGIVRMLGSVEAGFPAFAEVGELDTITLDEWLLGDRAATFMLRVKGESMIDAGIMDGDYVIVERGREPRIGNIVLATVDSAWTLKYYRKDKHGVYLEPANKKFKIIRPKETLEIPAVVVSVIRRYHK